MGDSTFTIQYSHRRVVALGGGPLELAPAFTGALSGFSMGTIQTAYANAIYGRPWYEGVTRSGFVGAAGGMAAGYVMGKVMPRLPGKGAAAVVSRMAMGGLVGGGVSGGTQVALNVATERPWDEGLGPAINVGWTTGSLDAFMDYYGGRLMDRQLGKRPVRSLAEDADRGPWKPSLREFAGRLLADEMGGFRLGPAEEAPDVGPRPRRPMADVDEPKLLPPPGEPTSLADQPERLLPAPRQAADDIDAAEAARFLAIRNEVESLQGKAYIQKNGTARPTFDPANAEVPVLLGYTSNLRSYSEKIPGVSYLDTEDLPSGIFGPWAGKGLARADLRGAGSWRNEFLDAINNTNTINFIVDGMEIYKNPGMFDPDKPGAHQGTTHWEMDQVIRRGYTDKLHLWWKGRELSPQETSRWLDRWKTIRKLP